MKTWSFMKKALAFALVLAVVCGIAGLRMKDALVRRFIVETLHAAGGFDVAMDRLHVGLLSPVMTIEGLNISNPSNFPVRDALRIHRLLVRYDRWSLLRQQGHFPEIDLDLSKIVLVRMADGATNLGQLEKVGASPSAQAAQQTNPSSPSDVATSRKREEISSPPAKSPVSIDRPLHVDRLRIKIDAIDYYDYALGGSEPMVIPAEIHLDQTFTNVTDIADVVDQMQAKLDISAMLGGFGSKPPPVPEEQRKKSERELQHQFERVVEGL